MRMVWAAILAAISAAWMPAVARAQGAPADPILVSSEHPRLFLRPARLRLLRRERERTSLRWEQFHSLMAGNAAMPEPGFALALYYEVAGDKDAGRKAIAWAFGPAADLRQMALVFDWCYDLMSDGDRQSFAARLAKKMADSAADAKTASSVRAVRSRALAAITLFDEVPDAPAHELERVIRQWWDGAISPAIKNGVNPIARDDAYALYELLHAVQDNVKIDLRESNPGFFKDVLHRASVKLLPAPLQSPENDYFIGAERAPGEPDLQLAALSRAAELAMVAYDANAPDTQVLQGWLMHDKYLMRGAFGIPYEFLWANPYQPGLSYYHVPLVFLRAGARTALHPLQLGRRGQLVRRLRRNHADLHGWRHKGCKSCARAGDARSARSALSASARTAGSSSFQSPNQRRSSSWVSNRGGYIRSKWMTKRSTKRRPIVRGF